MISYDSERKSNVVIGVAVWARPRLQDRTSLAGYTRVDQVLPWINGIIAKYFHPGVGTEDPRVVTDNPWVVTDNPWVVNDNPWVVTDNPWVVTDNP